MTERAEAWDELWDRYVEERRSALSAQMILHREVSPKDVPTLGNAIRTNAWVALPFVAQLNVGLKMAVLGPLVDRAPFVSGELDQVRSVIASIPAVDLDGSLFPEITRRLGEVEAADQEVEEAARRVAELLWELQRHDELKQLVKIADGSANPHVREIADDFRSRGDGR